MKKKRKRGSINESVNNWQTMSDVVTALLLVVLLINMVLILYIVRIPDENLVDDVWGDDEHRDNYGEGNHYYTITPSFTPTVSPTPRYYYPYNHGGGGGGGGGGHTRTPEPTHTFYTELPTYSPTPEFLPALYPEGEGTEKAAVYVLVIDAETERTIKELGVEFELLDEKNAVQTLKTYYPQTVGYKLFETTERGVFYLPEKVSMGTYYLKELTEPVGYDASAPVEFVADTSYDWPEPLTVKVALYPSRNIIRLQMKDMETGAGVGGGVYDIVAAEAIMTADGTLRHAEGDVVGHIELDENGYGESEELFLGLYTLRQSVIPEFYAGDKESFNVLVEKKKGSDKPALQTLTCLKTAVTATLRDELYTNVTIAGAEFILTSEGAQISSRLLASDRMGSLAITNLAKSTRYTLKQLSSQGDYLFPTEALTFTVDATGRIDGEVRRDNDLYNHMIRLRIGVRDRMLRTTVSDYNVSLFNRYDELVGMWNSSGMMETITGVEPGDYLLRLNGSDKNSLSITVRDTKELQDYSFYVWTSTGVAILGGAGTAVLAGLIVGIIIAIKKKKKKNA